MTDSLEFRIHGMDCADEVAILKREIGPIVGAADDRLMFDILRGKMTVIPGTPAVTAQQVQDAVGRTGMRAEPWLDVQPDAARLGFWQRRGRTLLTAASGILLTAGFLVHATLSGFLSALGSEGTCIAESPPPAAVALCGRRLVCGPAGMARASAFASGYESANDHRRDWRGCHRRVV